MAHGRTSKVSQTVVHLSFTVFRILASQRGILPVLLLLAGMYSVARGQVLYGSLTGNVTDTTGAYIPNATVKAVDTLTGFNRTVRSNEAGIYKFSDLVPGDYTVTITVDGYGLFEQKRLAIQVNAVERVDAAVAPVPWCSPSP